MTKFLEFTSEADAKAFQAKMDTLEGYPNKATKTEHYCLVTKHPSQKRWACPVDTNEQDALTGLEKAALKTPLDVAAFFPTEA